MVLAPSGDKGANINFGVFLRQASHYPWLQAFFTRAKMAELMGDDWRRKEYFMERMGFHNIWAVHFVMYGPLGRGVSSCRLLDALGKGFADYMRDKVVDIPPSFWWILRLSEAEAGEVVRKTTEWKSRGENAMDSGRRGGHCGQSASKQTNCRKE
jgi:hypothetical protein